MMNMNMKEKEDNDIIEQLKALPRYGPRAVFRMKVFASTLVPSLGTALAGSRTTGLGWGARPAWTRPGRMVAAAGMALLLAFIVFSSLMLASGSSLPGEALYGLKRAREQIGLALTWSQQGKAEQNLSLAAARLSELDNLIQKGVTDSDRIKQLASDYTRETAAVAQALKQNPGSGESQVLAKRLQALQTQKANMVSRLAAASPAGVYAESEGAAVKVKDATGAGPLGPTGQVSGVTNSEGEYSFGVNASNPDRLSGLDAFIEQDGRKEVVPVFESVKAKGPYAVQVDPPARVLELDKPTMFTMKITRGDGSPVAMKPIKLIDASLTSAVNGRKGEALLWTDASGACSFTVTKTSRDASSRFDLQVEEAGWTDAGEVLRLGGLEAPATAAASDGVAVTSIGGNTNPQRLELDNGLVKVVAEHNTAGEIISSLVRSTGSTAAGPLSDTLPVEAHALSEHVTAGGPTLIFATDKAAGYETRLEMQVAGGSVVKTYQVVVASGNPYASISCKVVVTGSAVQLARANPGLLKTFLLSTPAGASIEVGGKKVSPPAATEQNLLLSFEIGNPYIAYSTNSDVVFIACPIDSETYPQAWSLSSGTLSPSPRDTSALAENGYNSMIIFGMAERADLDSVVSKARAGIGDPARVASSPGDAQSSNGFALVVRPGLEELQKGSHQVTLKVFKQYQKVLQAF